MSWSQSFQVLAINADHLSRLLDHLFNDDLFLYNFLGSGGYFLLKSFWSNHRSLKVVIFNRVGDGSVLVNASVLVTFFGCGNLVELSLIRHVVRRTICNHQLFNVIIGCHFKGSLLEERVFQTGVGSSLD
jgi:hypothetical protein